MDGFCKNLLKVSCVCLLLFGVQSQAKISGADQSTNAQPAATNAVTVKPKLISNSCGEPIYPAISRRNGEEGRVGVQLWINESGNVVTAKVAVSSGFPALDEGAITFLSRCKFEPATKDGIPTAVWFPIYHRWTLADSPDEKPVTKGDYTFEDKSRSMSLLVYLHESCSNYVSGFNNNETQDYESLGIKKLSEGDVCGCAEKAIKADNYLKVLAVDPEPDVGMLMDEKKFQVYLMRKMTAVLMQCTAKSIDASIAKLDPRKTP